VSTTILSFHIVWQQCRTPVTDSVTAALEFFLSDDSVGMLMSVLVVVLLFVAVTVVVLVVVVHVFLCTRDNNESDDVLLLIAVLSLVVLVANFEADTVAGIDFDPIPTIISFPFLFVISMDASFLDVQQLLSMSSWAWALSEMRIVDFHRLVLSMFSFVTIVLSFQYQL